MSDADFEVSDYLRLNLVDEKAREGMGDTVTHLIRIEDDVADLIEDLELLRAALLMRIALLSE